MTATTSGPVALVNLTASIDGHRRAAARMSIPHNVALLDLVCLRGRLLGRISDYEWAASHATQLCRAHPGDGTALVARARTRALLHRFETALDDLDHAQRRGVEPGIIATERAGVLQAIGRYEEAAAILSAAVGCRADFASLAAWATLAADRGDVADAERLFQESRDHYCGVSPIPLADLDFQRGHLWLAHGDLERADQWLSAAHTRMPGHAPATGHLAEAQAALGHTDVAVALLRPLAVAVEDPNYAATLAQVLYDAGRPQEASEWRKNATARYEPLLQRHPDTFADHAAELFLQPGGDPARAHALAAHNYAVRPTPKAWRLLARARSALPFAEDAGPQPR